MKKLFFLAICLISINFVQAQCSHAQKAAAKSCVGSASISEAALKAAAADPSIEKKECKESGKVCFVRKTVDEAGVASTTEVRFDESTSTFVNQMPELEAASAGKAEGGAKAKSCCKGGAAKACCKGGAKSCSKGSASATKVERTSAEPAPNE